MTKRMKFPAKEELEKQLEEIKKQLAEQYPDLKIKPEVASTTVIKEEDVYVLPKKAKKLKPGPERGSLMGEWQLEDFGPRKKWVKFTPMPIEEMRNHIRKLQYDDGSEKYWLYVRVNGCGVWLQLYVENTVPAAFYHFYKNQEEESANLRRFRKDGPGYAPWTHGGMSGQNTWMEGVAASPWFDANGRFVSSRTDYIMIDGVPHVLDDVLANNIQFLRAGRLENAAGKEINYKAPTRREHMERIRNQRETHIVFKDGKAVIEEIDGHKEESQRGIKHGSKVSVPTGSDEQPKLGNRRGNRKPRSVPKGQAEATSGNAA